MAAAAAAADEARGRLAMKDKATLQLMKLDVGDKFSHIPLPKASVLIPLTIKDGKLCVLFTLRSMKLRRSPGEVCFPGGRSEPADKDEVATALREAEEEIGLRPEQAEVICRLAPLIDKTNSLVTPVVAFIEDTFQAYPNPEEVSDVFFVPLEYFISPSKYKAMTFQNGNFTYVIHTFEYDDPEHKTTFTIWGLTAQFAIYVALAIFGEKPTYKVNYDLDTLKSSAENNFMEYWNMTRSKL
uniref:Peroxisomal coenzyme A diphosphatase NUDT7 isoform X1 n=2 Tax=Pogona vitticeps TaxID=103695 RepID=A0A6J0VHD8_9SAUR